MPRTRSAKKSPARAPARKGRDSFPAKLTAPHPVRTFKRDRLYKYLDEKRNSPGLWLSAPGGAGKTTLIASYLRERNIHPVWYQLDEGDTDLASFFHYLGIAGNRLAPRRKPLPALTPEYFAGLTIFARNFFREFFGRLSVPGVLVLDNVQELPDHAPLRELLPLLLAELPVHRQVIMLSREAVPANLSRAKANGQLDEINWGTLQLSREEGIGIGRLLIGHARNVDRLVECAVDHAHGWVAGLVLLLEQGLVGPDTATMPAESDPAKAFSYFATEIFSHIEPSERDFLLRTAFLPKVAADSAVVLNTDGLGPELLRRFARRNFFTHRQTDGTYEYHPLFRAFLLEQARVQLSPGQLRQYQQNAAKALTSSGNLASAIELLIEAKDWTAVVPLILEHAGTFVQQGRAQTIMGWLNALPDELRNAQPWILFWRGICQLPINQALSRIDLEKAYWSFEKGSDVDPLFLTWSAIVDSYLIEWEDYGPLLSWLDRYSTLSSQWPAPLPETETASVLSYVTACIYAKPDLPELDAQIQRALSLIEANVRHWFLQGALLAFALTLMRKMSDVAPLFQLLGRCATSQELTPHENILWHLIQGARAWFTDYPDACTRCMSDGLSLAAQHGIHVYDNVLTGLYSIGELTSGNLAAARESANRFLPSVQGSGAKAALMVYCGGAVSFQEGQWQRALEEFNQSVRYSNNAHWSFSDAMNGMPLAVLNAKLGNSDAYLARIKEYMGLGYRIRCPVVQYFTHFAEAKLHWWRDEPDLALRSTRLALQIAGQEGRTALPSWLLREEASVLLNFALEEAVEVGAARAFIDKCRLPAPPGITSDAWPFPVKIYTLGRFGLLCDGISVTKGVSGKPLEMLKALIAFGARDVAQEKLSDVLWSEAEGDAGRRSFDITLHRLRKLFGHDEVLPLLNGRLTLDPRYCWVDVWSLEREMAKLEKMILDQPHAEILVERLDRLWQLYRGPFLNTDRSYPFAIATRERLHVRLVNLIRDIGNLLEHHDRTAAASRCYEQVLAIDPLVETFYRRLIRLHTQQGRHAEALRVYERCRVTLKEILGIAPSEKTEAAMQASVMTRHSLKPTP